MGENCCQNTTKQGKNKEMVRNQGENKEMVRNQHSPSDMFVIIENYHTHTIILYTKFLYT